MGADGTTVASPAHNGTEAHEVCVPSDGMPSGVVNGTDANEFCVPSDG